jgi:hypothetical protein
MEHDVVLHQRVMGAVDHDSPLMRILDGVALEVAIGTGFEKVEMQRVAALDLGELA